MQLNRLWKQLSLLLDCTFYDKSEWVKYKKTDKLGMDFQKLYNIFPLKPQTDHVQEAYTFWNT